MLRRATTAVAGLAALTVLAAGCSDDDGSGEGSDPPSQSAPTGSPFTAELEGPDLAAPGDVLTVTVENTGRLPDRYALRFDPLGAAAPDPLELSLAPGESGEVQLTVREAPLVVTLESAGGGPGGVLDSLSIGGQEQG